MFDLEKRTRTEIEIKAVLDKHVPNKKRKYKFHIIDTVPLFGINAWSMFTDPQPFVGEVIDYDPGFMYVKLDVYNFRAVSLPYATEIPKIGSMVKVTPYARRNFDGERSDSYINSLKSAREIQLAKWYELDKTCLPVANIHCPMLLSLINGVEGMAAPDGARTIAEMLVDANATDFTVNDPGLEGNADSLPSITFRVSTSICTGDITISCDKNADLFSLVVTQNGVIKAQEVDFERLELGAKIASVIDDDSWRKTIVEVVND